MGATAEGEIELRGTSGRGGRWSAHGLGRHGRGIRECYSAAQVSQKASGLGELCSPTFAWLRCKDCHEKR